VAVHARKGLQSCSTLQFYCGVSRRRKRATGLASRGDVSRGRRPASSCRFATRTTELSGPPIRSPCMRGRIAELFNSAILLRRQPQEPEGGAFDRAPRSRAAAGERRSHLFILLVASRSGQQSCPGHPSMPAHPSTLTTHQSLPLPAGRPRRLARLAENLLPLVRGHSVAVHARKNCRVVQLCNSSPASAAGGRAAACCHTRTCAAGEPQGPPVASRPGQRSCPGH